MSITAPDRLRRAETLYSRNHGPVICDERPPYVLPARPTGANAPLPHLSDDEYALLVDQILEDWDCATLSELGLYRAHRLTLEEFDAITDSPDFRRAHALVRSIRAKRRPEREAAARAAVFDRLLCLVHQTPESAAGVKESRLACKQITAMLDAEADPDTDPGAPDEEPRRATEPDTGVGIPQNPTPDPVSGLGARRDPPDSPGLAVGNGPGFPAASPAPPQKQPRPA